MDIESEGSDQILQEKSSKTPTPKKFRVLTTPKAQTKAANGSTSLFSGHLFVFIPYGIELSKKRIEILKNICLKQKAEVIDLVFFTWELLPGKLTFIIISKEMKWDYLQKQVHSNYISRIPDFVFVDCDWISMCLQKKQYLDPTPFIIPHPSQLTQFIEQQPLEKEIFHPEARELHHQDTSDSVLKTTEMVHESDAILRESDLKVEESDSMIDESEATAKSEGDVDHMEEEKSSTNPQQPTKFTNELSEKMFALMKASRDLYDFSYEKKATVSKPKEPVKREPEDIRVKEEMLISTATKAEEIKDTKGKIHDEDEVIFMEPKSEDSYKRAADKPQSSSQLNAVKTENIKAEGGTKRELSGYAGYDPTFFGDEDVFVSKAIDVKKEFLSEKDLEGTILEGIEDFSHVNKNLEGNLSEVKELRLLNPGQRSRDLKWNLKREKFPCAHGANKENPNAHIISELENVLKAYSNLQDKGRTIAYNKAIASLKTYPKKIESEEDLKQLPYIGEKTKKKILEIIKTGSLRQARLIENDEQQKALTLFTNIWGVGTDTAQKWYKMGFRTLEDLKQHPEVLNKDQALGVKYFEDFQKRIPRAEVEEIVKRVQQKIDELSDIKGVYEMIPCGSYRRGKASSGDVDLLMTRKDGKNFHGFLYKLIKSLEGDLITDHLKMPNIGSHDSETYMGWCMIPEVGIHRRLDIKIYPREHFAFAVLYFTGSKNFNRSMRHFARNKGYALSDHGLFPANRVNNESVWQGKSVPCYTEEEIFRFLGLEYKSPEERDLG